MSYVSPMGAYIQTDSSSGVMASVDETIVCCRRFWNRQTHKKK